MPTYSERSSKAPFYTILLLLALAGTTFYVMFYTGKGDQATLIAEDIAKLVVIFEKIDETCDIIDFDNQKNPINFLTVKKDGFVGSQVGSMNLVYPENWQGPYLQENPTLQSKEFQIVRTRAGYFITPGQGVELPNGKVIGKDIILDEKADIFELMRNPHGLMYKDKALAAPLMTGPQEHHANYEQELIAEELVSLPIDAHATVKVAQL